MKRSLLFLILTLFFAVTSVAQDKMMPVKPSGDEKYIQMVDEVYGSDFFKGKEDLKIQIADILKNNISYSSKPGVGKDENIKLLSTVPIMKTVDPKKAMEALKSFNEETFNPLFFSIALFPKNKAVVYRVDGTDILLVIKPQNSK